jgi:proliferating cell nuclear antigen
MNLKTIQACAFKSLLEVLKDIISDVNLWFDKSGMKIVAFDVARVTLVHMFMAAENFEEYSCSKELFVGINVLNMFKLLKSITNNDILSMSITDENLNIVLTNDSKKSTSKFSIKLLDLNEDILEIPDIDMPFSTSIPSLDFQKIVRDMSNISDDMTITRSSNTIQFESLGDFASKTTILEQNEDIGDNTTTGVFNLKYLSMFTKATILCPIVQIIQSDDDSPVIFKYNIANLGELRFYLAPTVQS